VALNLGFLPILAYVQDLCNHSHGEGRAGLGVAMGNASPALKAAADYIAPPVDNEGVVEIIERFILN
jgi:hypothetical protein